MLSLGRPVSGDWGTSALNMTAQHERRSAPGSPLWGSAEGSTGESHGQQGHVRSEPEEGFEFGADRRQSFLECRL